MQSGDSISPDLFARTFMSPSINPLSPGDFVRVLGAHHEDEEVDPASTTSLATATHDAAHQARHDIPESWRQAVPSHFEAVGGESDDDDDLTTTKQSLCCFVPSSKQPLLLLCGKLCDQDLSLSIQKKNSAQR